MPRTYETWERTHAKRGHHKIKDYRTVFKYLRLRKTANGTMTFHFVQKPWNKEPGEYLLASMTPDNKLTFHLDFNKYDGYDRITVTNRIALLTGVSCGFNKRSHPNKESYVRFYTSTYSPYFETDSEGNRLRRYRQEPCYSWTSKLSIPYNPGICFQIDQNGEIAELVHAEPDRRIQVKPEVSQQTKADTAVLRKLLLVMARIGTFDDHMASKMKATYLYKPMGTLEEVNYHAPTGRDAEIVFTHGLHNAYPTPRHYYLKGTYYERTDDERMVMLRNRAVENGMKALRKVIYESQDAYEKIEV